MPGTEVDQLIKVTQNAKFSVAFYPSLGSMFSNKYDITRNHVSNFCMSSFCFLFWGFLFKLNLDKLKKKTNMDIRSSQASLSHFCNILRIGKQKSPQNILINWNLSKNDTKMCISFNKSVLFWLGICFLLQTRNVSDILQVQLFKNQSLKQSGVEGPYYFTIAQDEHYILGLFTLPLLQKSKKWMAWDLLLLEVKIFYCEKKIGHIALFESCVRPLDYSWL